MERYYDVRKLAKAKDAFFKAVTLEIPATSGFVSELKRAVHLAKGKSFSEDRIAQYLVVPMLRVLGFDPYNSDEVEYRFQDSNIGYHDVYDFALKRDGQPVMLGLVRTAESFEGTRRTLSPANGRSGVVFITDGIHYKFYLSRGYRFPCDNPLFRFDAQSWTPNQLHMLSAFHKSNLNRMRMALDDLLQSDTERLICAQWFSGIRKKSLDFAVIPVELEKLCKDNRVHLTEERKGVLLQCLMIYHERVLCKPHVDWLKK